MSKASDAANAMMYAVEQVSGLYGVFTTRMHSRTFMVEGAAGRYRPMYVGEWTDHYGVKHRRGMADLLARPRVPIHRLCERDDKITCPVPPVCRKDFMALATIPVWIECKTGRGRMEPDQIAFKNYVETNGETYLLLHDEVDTWLQWLEAHGVEKQFTSTQAYRESISIPFVQVENAICRHCDEVFSLHTGKIKACNPQKAMGKVWSPQLRRGAPAR